MKLRHCGRDCRNPEAKDGDSDLHPCILDVGNPCRHDVLHNQTLCEALKQVGSFISNSAYDSV